MTSFEPREDRSPSSIPRWTIAALVLVGPVIPAPPGSHAPTDARETPLAADGTHTLRPTTPDGGRHGLLAEVLRAP